MKVSQYANITDQVFVLSLEGHISLWRTRRETLVWLVTLIIQTGTVSLWRLAGHVDTRAKTLSVHRRFERFFQYVRLDDGCVARLLVHIMGLSGKPWHLALDRTNWKFGRCHINFFYHLAKRIIDGPSRVVRWR